MDINFEYDNVNASSRLEILVKEKLNKLFEKYDSIIRADVFFKTENTSSPETGKICQVTEKMMIIIRPSQKFGIAWADTAMERANLSISEFCFNAASIGRIYSTVTVFARLRG